MCLELPRFEELSNEQKHAFQLVGDDTYLVTGPPGTGKSVIALFRAASLQRIGKGRQPALLTFSKLLTTWTAQALEDACEALEADVSKITVKTVDAWIGSSPNSNRGWFYETFDVPIPRVNNGGNGYQEIDWNAAFQIAASVSGSVEQTLDLIIDEAQDLNAHFWDIVLPYCRSCTVFCDTKQTQKTENQTYTDLEIAAMLGIDKDDDKHWATLSINYRNTGYIAETAQTFSPPQKGEVVSLPKGTKKGSKPLIRSSKKFDDAVKHIANVATNYSNYRIGLLVNSTADVRRAMRLLEELQSKPQFKNLSFQEYRAGVRDFDPCESGILVTWAPNAKGLEFDHVYAARLQDWPYPMETSHKNRLYVVMTRAKTHLELMWDGGNRPPILDSLPLHLFDEDDC